ncbi:MAG: hypothetical protein EXS10_07450 [Phycisphaerales bacterium]|nr:hypothetical protein [Phycisphaerales bacterium]
MAMTDIERLIEDIRDVNPSVSAEWLGRFSQIELAHYLDHLRVLTLPRGSSWERRDNLPAISAYEAA